MLKDLSLGTILYIIISLAFGHEFDATLYAISLAFAILPDVDFIVYAVLRKRFSLVTHRFIHYPIFFAAVGTGILFFNPYIGTLFLILTLDHFLLDTFASTTYPTGIQWLFPFSRKSWYLFHGKTHALTEAQQANQLQKRKLQWNTSKEERTLLWEILVRIDSLTTANITLVLLAFLFLAWFLFEN